VLTLVQLDRRTGALLSESILGRGSDYVVDYATGLLRFLNIILPYDDAHAGRLRFNAGFADADAAYDNPYGNYTVPGLISINALAGLQLSRISELQLRYLSARNELPASTISQAVDNTDAATALTLRVTPSARFEIPRRAAERCRVEQRRDRSGAVRRRRLAGAERARYVRQFFTALRHGKL
jgi:hypothetical protein